MKLLYCKNCESVFNLTNRLKKCSCGETKGKYVDNRRAWYDGINAIPIGINNYSFDLAVKNQKNTGEGNLFKAFITSKNFADFFKLE